MEPFIAEFTFGNDPVTSTDTLEFRDTDHDLGKPSQVASDNEKSDAIATLTTLLPLEANLSDAGLTSTNAASEHDGNDLIDGNKGDDIAETVPEVDPFFYHKPTANDGKNETADQTVLKLAEGIFEDGEIVLKAKTATNTAADDDGNDLINGNKGDDIVDEAVDTDPFFGVSGPINASVDHVDPHLEAPLVYFDDLIMM